VPAAARISLSRKRLTRSLRVSYAVRLGSAKAARAVTCRTTPV
jgi:hypothetical protein